MSRCYVCGEKIPERVRKGTRDVVIDKKAVKMPSSTRMVEVDGPVKKVRVRWLDKASKEIVAEKEVFVCDKCDPSKVKDKEV